MDFLPSPDLIGVLVVCVAWWGLVEGFTRGVRRLRQ